MPRVEHPTSPLVPKLEGLHLFHFDGAPCAQRVRFALAEKGLRRGREVPFAADDPAACAGEPGAWVSRVVSLVRKDHLTDAYAAIHPNLVVPALVDDGVLYVESMDIVSYVDAKFGGEPLLPRDDAARAEDVLQLVQLGESMHRSVRFVSFRWGLRNLGRLSDAEEQKLQQLLQDRADGEKLVEFYQGYDHGAYQEDVYLSHLRALEAAFTNLDERLAAGQRYLTGATLTLADVIWSMKVLRLEECGYPFRSLYPALHAWYRRMARRPAFEHGVMGRHRFMNRAFRIKAGVENVLGLGLKRVARRGPGGARSVPAG